MDGLLRVPCERCNGLVKDHLQHYFESNFGSPIGEGDDMI